MKWYVLFVETGKEDLVKTYIKLHMTDYISDVLVPKKKIAERKQGVFVSVTKTLFPGYVLIHSNLNFNVYSKIKSIPRVYAVLSKSMGLKKQNSEYYTPLSEQEVYIIKKLTGEGDVVEYTQFIEEGKKIRISSGPLEGMEGIIRKVNRRKQRVKVALKLLDTEFLVDLGIDILY